MSGVVRLPYESDGRPTRSQLFVRRYREVLETGQDFYNYDACLERPEASEGKRRFLLVMASPAMVKSLSATVSALADMFISGMSGEWYFDVAYLPTKKDLALYDKCGIPYCLGQQLHLDASYYDVVGFSISVIHECVTVPQIVKSFSRCDRRVPLTWSERKDLSLGECPVLMCGGITASYANVTFGPLGNDVYKDDRVSYLDFMCLGIGETTARVCGVYREMVGSGCTLQDYIDECMGRYDFVYQPQAYRVVYDGCRIVENVKVNPRARDWVSPYYPDYIPEHSGEGRSYVQANGSNAGFARIGWSESCTGYGVCTFCAEGSYCGRWEEKSLDRIREDCLRVKLWSAADSSQPLSFNCNHMSDFSEAVRVMRESFPSVYFLNMRLEELYRTPGALELLSELGEGSVAVPIEGISCRIRQGLLNKNLTDEAIRAVLESYIGKGFRDIKLGIILTGYETDADWDEFRALVVGVRERAFSMGKSYHVRVKATPLIYYPNTGLELKERKVTRKAFDDVKLLDEEQYRLNGECELGMRINGFRGGTAFEQMILDLGVSLTPWFHHNVVACGGAAYSLRDVVSESLVGSFKSLVLDRDAFFGERSVGAYISPCHRVRVALEGVVASYWRRLEGLSFDELSTESTGKCLYTYDGCKAVCGHGVIKGSPVRKYADVRLVDGRLVGSVYEDLTGCSVCKSAAERRERQLARAWSFSSGVGSMESLRVGVRRSVYRLVLSRTPDYGLLNPNAVVYTTVAALLRHSEVLLASYWRVVEHSMSIQSNADLCCASDGLLLVDVEFRDDVYDELVDVLGVVNDWLVSARIVKVISLSEGERLHQADLNVFRFVSKGISRDMFLLGAEHYRGGYRKKGKSGHADVIERRVDSSLSFPVYKVVGDVIEGYFCLPRKYNPYLYFQEVLIEGRFSQKRIQRLVTFSVVSYLRESSDVFCSCGGRAVYSVVTGRQLGKCRNCFLKALLRR